MPESVTGTGPARRGCLPRRRCSARPRARRPR
jgi:hypothetical protein